VDPEAADGGLFSQLPPGAVAIGLDRTVTLYSRSSTSYQIHEKIRRLYF
jgi:hypothetical protein